MSKKWMYCQARRRTEGGLEETGLQVAVQELGGGVVVVAVLCKSWVNLLLSSTRISL